MIWAEALELIKQGKKLRAVDWLPGNYCKISEDALPEATLPNHPMNKWLPFELIEGFSPDGDKFGIHTGDTIGEWELYD